MTDDIYENIEQEKAALNGNVVKGQHIAQPKPWLEKLLNPVFRQWAYGVAAAAVVAGGIWAGKPEFAVVALPLIMALFNVDKDGVVK